MFDKKWAYKDGEQVEMRDLPYFIHDSVSNTLIETTTCAPDTLKQFGWYDVVFNGNRDMFFYEEPEQIVYNSARDEVEVINYKLKDGWREILLEWAKQPLLSPGYEEFKSKIDVFIVEIEAYFRSDKYDSDQLYSYAKILQSYGYDVVSYCNRNRSVVNGFIKTDVYDKDTEENIVPKQTMLNYINDNPTQFDGKRIACIGLNGMSSGVFLKKLGKNVDVIDNNYSDFGTNSFHTCVGTVFFSIINDVYTPFIEVEYYDSSSHDVLIFDMAFTSNVAQKNVDLMRAAKDAGKDVLVYSISIWNNSNPYVQVDTTQFTSLYEYDGAHVFTLT